MATVDELRSELGSTLVDRVLEAVSADGPEWYRKELAELGGFKKKYEEAAAKLDSIERTPKVEAAFKEAGVDWDNLRPLERNQLLAFKDFENQEALAAFINDNGLPTTQQAGEPGGGDPSSVPAAARIAQQAASGGQTTDTDSAFYAELDAAKPGEETRNVLAKWGRLQE